MPAYVPNEYDIHLSQLFESIFSCPLIIFKQKTPEILENFFFVEVFTTSSKINITFHQHDGFKYFFHQKNLERQVLSTMYKHVIQILSFSSTIKKKIYK